MSFFSRLNFWQKGLVAGFAFSLLLSIVYTGVLIYVEFMFESRGLPHTCYMILKTVPCTFTEAVAARLGFIAVFLVLIGIPVAAIGGLLGYIVDRIRIQA